MKINKLWLATILGAQLTFTSLAADGTTDTNRDADIEALKQQLRELGQKVQALESQRAAEQQAATNIANGQIQELDQKVRILARERELDQEAAAALAKTQPKLTVGPGGLTASSADSNFVFSLKAVLQVDDRTFLDGSGAKGNDGLLLRRARPIFQGTLYRDFDFVFVPDFGGSSVQIFDAYANYRYEPWAQLRVGKFKTPVGLEQLQSDVNTSFNERSLVTDLVPNRDVGVQLWGDINGGVLSYAVGIFNGVGDSRNTGNVNTDNNGEFAGRLFSLPFKNTDIAALQNFGLGVAGSSGNVSTTAAGLPSTTGGTLPGYTTDGQQQFFAYNPAVGAVQANGNHWRLSPQGYYYYGPLSLLGEYAISDQGVLNTGTGAQAHLQNTAWEISGGWILTGENASFNGITPLHPFDPRKGQWGALQVVARYAELNIDDDAFPVFSNPATSASAAQAWSAGLNWYLNKNIRMNASYSHTTFTGGGGAGATAPAFTTRQPESVFFTRLQLAF
ncbi:MAG: porin [Verrucomicrobiales bacterium]|nr:porin [Verrucomicrobiales bacterium]